MKEHNCADLGCGPAALRSHQERLAQNLPATVEDYSALERVAAIVRASMRRRKNARAAS